MFIFGRSAGAWRQTSYIKASKTGPEDGFGVGLAFSAVGLIMTVLAKAGGSLEHLVHRTGGELVELEDLENTHGARS